MTARFITLEGGEGAGKSSQVARVADWLAARGHRVVCTREPGGTPLSEILRDLVLHGGHSEMSPMTELLLVFAARAQHIDELIRPSLAAGCTVLCDRFTDASFAYQGGGRGLPIADIETLERLVQRELTPDLTLLLDVPVQTGLSRTRGRNSEDRFETESSQFLEHVRQAYLNRAERHPERFEVIDASLDEASVWDQIQMALERRL
jgi:dTMP kinase